MLNIESTSYKNKILLVGAVTLVVSFMFVFLVTMRSMKKDSVIIHSHDYKGTGNTLSDSESSAENEGKCGLEKPGLGTLTKEQVGRITWEYMHTTIVNLKVDSIKDEKKRQNVIDKAVTMIKTTTELFPCVVCKDDFTNILRDNSYEQFLATVGKDLKPSLSLSLWLCTLHNKVNLKLDKKPFPCASDELEKRWKMGSKKC
jgi:hypothetical protein